MVGLRLGCLNHSLLTKRAIDASGLLLRRLGRQSNRPAIHPRRRTHLPSALERQCWRLPCAHRGDATVHGKLLILINNSSALPSARWNTAQQHRASHPHCSLSDGGALLRLRQPLYRHASASRGLMALRGLLARAAVRGPGDGVAGLGAARRASSAATITKSSPLPTPTSASSPRPPAAYKSCFRGIGRRLNFAAPYRACIRAASRSSRTAVGARSGIF